MATEMRNPGQPIGEADSEVFTEKLSQPALGYAEFLCDHIRGGEA